LICACRRILNPKRQAPSTGSRQWKGWNPLSPSVVAGFIPASLPQSPLAATEEARLCRDSDRIGGWCEGARPRQCQQVGRLPRPDCIGLAMTDNGRAGTRPAPTTATAAPSPVVARSPDRSGRRGNLGGPLHAESTASAGRTTLSMPLSSIILQS
jgi:hypothetical protein